MAATSLLRAGSYPCGAQESGRPVEGELEGVRVDDVAIDRAEA